MRDNSYDTGQITKAINLGLIPKCDEWFKITYSLVNQVALLKIEDKLAFSKLRPSKQKSLLRQYFRLAAINLLKYRDCTVVSKLRSREGFVYIMQDSKCPEFIKVGKSIEPARRLEEANCFSPEKSFRILRWFFCEDAYSVENLVHRTFKDYNTTGEWFKLNPSLVEELIKTQIHAPLAKLDKARSF
ncbi:hypothetical protein BI021_gp009 [Salmonella phage NR01]|uniref:Bacteriophage T5 Orf172 DNA-binding domain-containing protein n=1 Tax=Salmonella phage NR01 TaxID=1647411 RepID=A0A162E9D4_9CAUD|nr:hypothetical protein BI021_gp009 [Salmonella phage NR01]AKN44348.1 hypothetical protein NR01_0009 [Salmonella phage NR01]